MNQPEVLIRFQIPEEYRINAIQVTIPELQAHLKNRPGVIFNFYSQKYGILVKDFTYAPETGYFVDIEKRVVSHKFQCKGIERRDKLFTEKYIQPLVPKKYRSTFFDNKDAIRSYCLFITDIQEISSIAVSQFLLWQGKGKVTAWDELHHPRLVEHFSKASSK